MVMLMPSMTVMYALAVLKLHEPDSQRTPAAWEMIPTIESTAQRIQNRKVDVTDRLTRSDDDILQDRPLQRIHEVRLRGTIAPEAKLQGDVNLYQARHDTRRALLEEAVLFYPCVRWHS